MKKKPHRPKNEVKPGKAYGVDIEKSHHLNDTRDIVEFHSKNIREALLDGRVYIFTLK